MPKAWPATWSRHANIYRVTRPETEGNENLARTP